MVIIMDLTGGKQTLDKPPNIAHRNAFISSTEGEICVKRQSCNYFIERKRRCCNVDRADGSLYCVEHSGILQEGSVRKRVACPFDSSHSCFEDRLKKHLKKCSSRIELRPVFYKENINAVEGEDSDTKVTLSTVEIEEIEELILKVKQIFTENLGEVKKEKMFHPVLQEEADNPMNGPPARKHIAQQASLIGLMQKYGLLEDHICYTEFGAGKGGLSHWVQKALPDCTDTQYVLIDRGAVRYKLDNFHKGSHQGPTFERIQIDIQHLDMNCVPNFANDKPMVCTGKHLCGVATDFMLRCTMLFQPKSAHKSFIKGVVLALCCHHRCEWSSYVGKEFLERCGVSSRQFQLLLGMTSWATCATRHVKQESQTEGAAHESVSRSYSHVRYGDLLPQQREQLGNMAKNIIDWGRLKFLENHGYHGDLIQYVDKDCTLENVCLVARKSDACQTDYLVDNSVEEASVS